MKVSAPIADPRSVPLDSTVQAPLPPVALERLSRRELRRRFLDPGEWTPEIIDDDWRLNERPTVPAAVLVALIDRPAGLSLLLTLRSATLARHGGQIAFPGGRVDSDDASDIAAALREAKEEIGLESAAVEIIGQLPRYRTGTGYAIVPVIGVIDGDFDLATLRLEPNEVDEAFEVPLRFLMDPGNHQRRLFRWRQEDRDLERYFFAMPWRPDPKGDREYFIWGATAAILRNLYRFLAA